MGVLPAVACVIPANGEDRHDTGTYAHVVAKRAGLVDRLSQGARHQALPTLYAKPVPMEDPAALVRVENGRIKVENAMLRREIAGLKLQIESLKSPPPTIALPLPQTYIEMSAVVAAFCEALEIVGFRIEGAPCTPMHLQNARRTRSHSDPRLVAMWLCRVLCLSCSSPMIGRAFGKRDHTTVLHAARRGPEIIAVNPLLRAGAEFVLLKFKAKSETTP